MSLHSTADEIRKQFGTEENDIDKWINLLEQLSEIDEVVPQLIKDADREYWIVLALTEFLSMALKNKQNIALEKTVKGDFIETQKLIKANRLIPKNILDFYGYSYVILGGIYIDLPVVITNFELSNKLIKDFTDDRGFIEEIGLPDNYHYGTRKQTDSGFLISLAYNEICPRYIKSASDWSYFELF